MIIYYRAKKIQKNKNKAKYSRDWIYGYYYQDTHNTYLIETKTTKLGEVSRYFTPVFPETVCQYTNCIDINGEYLYHNDIIEGYFAYADIPIIVDFTKFCMLKKYQSYEFKKIGNVFDNPEIVVEIKERTR